jgi:probable phosphoglycerate mutase
MSSLWHLQQIQISMILARLYIARHGETDENRKGTLQGQLDTKLNATGITQAVCLAERFKDTRLDAAFSSDLSRAVKVSGIVERT